MRQVIYVWHYLDWGGAQIYFLALMKKAGGQLEVSAALPKNSSRQVFDYLHKYHIEYQKLESQTDLIAASGLFEKIALHARKMRAEHKLVTELAAKNDLRKKIIHIDIPFWSSFLPLARLARKTIVFTTIHTAMPDMRGWRRIVWKIKGRFISLFKNFYVMASNEEARASLYPYLARKKVDEAQVAYSGFDAEEILSGLSERNRIRGKYNLPLDRLIIVTVAQFIERKGRSIFLESVERLKTELPGLFFLWLGTSVLSKADESIIDKNYFRYLSPPDLEDGRADLLSLVSASDIFVLASLREGLPIALIEAMALGKPCIATRINAIPEAIEDNVDGILIEPGKADELVNAIKIFASDAELRERLGRSAKEKAWSRFTTDRAAEIVLAEYNKAINSK